MKIYKQENKRLMFISGLEVEQGRPHPAFDVHKQPELVQLLATAEVWQELHEVKDLLAKVLAAPEKEKKK
jgi:hypothetical protein